MNIYEKLNQVQSQLKVHKGQYNSFGGFKYRSLEDIVEGVKPLLAQHGLSLTLSDTVKLIGDRFYIEATATLVNVERPDEKIITTALAREAASKKSFDESQITGATSSYARKYSLGGLLNIDDTRDADAQNNEFSIPQTRSNNKIEPQMQYTGNPSTVTAGNNFQPPPINNYPQAMNNHTQTASHNNTAPPAANSAGDNAANSQDGRLSGKQYKFILSLMGNSGKSKEDMEAICISSYGRTLQHISKKDASQLIESLVAK